MKVLYFPLKILAKLMLAKYQPKIVAVTGSVGKTSTKNAIDVVLSKFFFTRKSYKSYNNQIGVPLTILGFKTPGKSFVGWLKIFLLSIARIIYQKNYPKILVLEMGADRLGDLEYLTSIARPDVGVITSIGSSHLEHFKTKSNLIKEKSTLVKKNKKGGTAILNFDDTNLRSLGLELDQEVLFYGFKKEANLNASNFRVSGEGIKFKMNFQGNSVPISAPVIGRFQVYNILAAFAVGSALGLDLIQMADPVKKYRAEKGRVRLLKGKKNIKIIDDSYNSSPESANHALEVLDQLNEPRRKVVILGDMLELGEKSNYKHRQLAKQAADVGDLLIFVGSKAKIMEQAAKKSGHSSVISYNSSSDLVLVIEEVVKDNDLILIKASQGVRLEKVAEQIIDESLDPKEVLVRQSKEWRN